MGREAGKGWAGSVDDAADAAVADDIAPGVDPLDQRADPLGLRLVVVGGACGISRTGGERCTQRNPAKSAGGDAPAVVMLLPGAGFGSGGGNGGGGNINNAGADNKGGGGGGSSRPGGSGIVIVVVG